MTRAVVALDPMPSPDEIRAIYRRRTGREVEEPPPSAITERRKGHRKLVVPARLPGVPPTAPVHVEAGHPAAPVLIATRTGNTLALTLRFAPRTKKNHKRHYAAQSPAYTEYRLAIVRALAPVLDRLALPLPPGAYNLRAHYYVDAKGRSADKCGLDQGLYDALQDAGVLLNDWMIRQDDGTRIYATDLTDPRVELFLTPLLPEDPP